MPTLPSASPSGSRPNKGGDDQEAGEGAEDRVHPLALPAPPVHRVLAPLSAVADVPGRVRVGRRRRPGRPRVFADRGQQVRIAEPLRTPLAHDNTAVPVWVVVDIALQWLPPHRAGNRSRRGPSSIGRTLRLVLGRAGLRLTLRPGRAHGQPPGVGEGKRERDHQGEGPLGPDSLVRNRRSGPSTDANARGRGDRRHPQAGI